MLTAHLKSFHLLLLGTYTDLHFMRLVLGLESVACLPLVVNMRVLGVLRLGYGHTTEWEEQEQVAQRGHGLGCSGHKLSSCSERHPSV
jgi:hypothetical protein